MKIAYCVQEVDQNVNNVIRPILINILNMIILIVSVVVQSIRLHMLTPQIQQITNAFYVI